MCVTVVCACVGVCVCVCFSMCVCVCECVFLCVCYLGVVGRHVVCSLVTCCHGD